MDPGLGSVEWVERTGGALTFADRLRLVGGSAASLWEALRTARQARRSGRRQVSLDLLEPPDTAMVRGAREHAARRCTPAITGHSIRTAYWTAAILHLREELTPRDAETAWVAALLHDIGLESPPPRGDFTLGGVIALKALAHEHRWSEEQVHQAAEAITSHPNTRVDPARFGRIAWAMNAGVVGELGLGPRRALLHPERVAELEARHPRAGLRDTLVELIASEVRRVPSGRFAFLQGFLRLMIKP
ncbi:MAG TPA: HD domain-containing protein [Myxococcales bacterium]|nr:HD domain-containing protein [Myxococcales bacterium]